MRKLLICPSCKTGPEKQVPLDFSWNIDGKFYQCKSCGWEYTPKNLNMKTETEIILDIVTELNQEFYDKTLIVELTPFEFFANGYAWAVTTSDYPLLSSEDGGLYDDNDQLIDIKGIIKTKFNEHVDMLHKGRFE